jgi:DNA-binding HxlR family transcriptional regulator
METKAVMKPKTIFTGKRERYDTALLTLLYDNEPLTAWELTGMMAPTGQKTSLHATLNKRLRSLEKEEYVTKKVEYIGKKAKGKWHLRIKGILAVLLLQIKPKKWNPKWTKIWKNEIKNIEESAQIPNLYKDNLQGILKALGLDFDDFTSWINLSKKVKELMEKRIINFDINEQTMIAIIIMQTKSPKQLLDLLKPNLLSSKK